MAEKVSFSISRLWNGKEDPLLNGDIFIDISDTTLDEARVSKTDTTPCIILSVDAPFYNDPVPSKAKDDISDSNSVDNKAFMGLWDFEVVEAFFLCSKTEQYLEIELGPHGHHLVLFLSGRKNIIEKCLPIKWDVKIDRKNMRWKGEAHIPFDYFPANVDKFNFYAIHGTDTELASERVYKSFKAVPGEHPDFHRLEYFEDISTNHPNILTVLNVSQEESVIWKRTLANEKTKSQS